MPKPCIIFDCDGVLVDSEKLANQVLVDLIKPQGIEMSLEEAIRRFKGCKMANCIAELEALCGHAFPEDFISNFRAEMSKAFEQELKPIDGIAAALNAIDNPKCVASSGPPEKIELALSVTGLIQHFRGRIFSSYVVKSWKPEPDLYLHAAKTMGYEPSDCIVIEDSLLGVQAGIAAGMKVLAYATDDDADALATAGGELFRDMGRLPELIAERS